MTSSSCKWIVPEFVSESTDDPVDEPPFTVEELKRLALAAGFRVLDGGDSSNVASAEPT